MEKTTVLPRVSVVICTYNQEQFVRDTLDSVLAQDYPELEIIVTDDGSTDGTPGILTEYEQRYPGKLIAVLSAVNTGIPGNINRGLARRTGKYVAWLDGDDLMLPTKIEKQARFLESRPDAIGCYHDADVFDSETGTSLGPMSVLYNGSPELKQGLLGDWMRPRYFASPSSIMARSSAIPKNGYDERMKYLSEALFFIEVFRNGPLLAIDEVLVRYRRHGANVTASKNARDLFLEYELMMYGIVDARYPELRSIVRRLRRACMLQEAVKSSRNGNRARSNQFLRNVMLDDLQGFVKGFIVFAGLRLLRQRIGAATSGTPYTRSGRLTRLARKFLE
jgi:glycosyltransferase involved in cell wall biosynthesis